MPETTNVQQNVKVRIPCMIQDPTMVPGGRPNDHYHCTLERNYWDGPVSDRVAVLDFDPETGELAPGLKYLSPESQGTKTGKFDVPRVPNTGRRILYQIDRPEFMQASVFGTVLRTMKLFEHKNVLGHPVRWAFDGPQLLVVPRAGERANAFYQRGSRSLQFFFFRPHSDTPGEQAPVVYTSLSRDIVAHETAHAILDGIVPDIYDALTPESLALHEAVADLVAVMMAAESQGLVTDVLEATRGAITDSTAFSAIAPQFGAALDKTGKAKYLRQLVNEETLASVAERDPDEPHDLSKVLSGALFAVLIRMHDERRAVYVEEPRWREFEDPGYSCSGAAFKAACFRLRNNIFQALEYLPPGEVSFADYGRAILAVDRAGNLNRPFVREGIREEFLRRGIVEDLAELDLPVDYEHEALAGVDLEELMTDDDLARRFAEDHRELLEIPAEADFEVRRRQRIEKTYYDTDRNEVPAREGLFKVVWPHLEANEAVTALPGPREVLWGTTLVIDLVGRRVRAVLSSDRSDRQRRARDRMFKRLWEDGLLARNEHALAPDGRRLESLVQLDTSSGNLRIRGAGNLLHLAE